MKIKYCIAATLLLVLQHSPYAQTLPAKALQLHQKPPSVSLTMINYKTRSAKLADFKNKLLILDFWSTICSSCIHHFAELDALQHRFGDSICILPVSCAATGDNTETVTRFIKGYRQRINDGFMLPSVVNDKVLDKLFPHKTLPHFVWINRGVYINATTEEQLTEDNIRNVLNTPAVKLPQKINKPFFDITKPLQAYTNSKDLISASVITPYISGLESSLGFTHNQVTGPKLYAINFSAFGLYKFAYAGAAFLPPNRVINELDSSHNLFGSITGNNNNGNTTALYCYQLTATGMDDDAMLIRMRQDLCNYFQVQAKLENRTTKCLVLQTSDTALLPVIQGISGNSLYDDIKTERMMINQPLSELIERLNQLLPLPLIDETGIVKNISLKMPNDLTDIPALTNMLKTQGIMVTTEYRNIKMFVLSNAPDILGENNTEAQR